MSEETVFGDPKDETKDEVLFELGGRKFTVDAAKKKIESADEHIKRIEEENAKLRTDLEGATTMDKVMEAMSKNQDNKGATSPATDPDNIAKMVQRIVEDTEEKRQREANILKVDSSMKEQYGDKAKEVLTHRSQELGLGIQTVMDIAAKSPAAFMELFKGAPETNLSTANKGEQVSTNTSDGPAEGTYAFYSKMRKDNPKLYQTAAVQGKMLKDAERLGPEQFFG
jgi:glycerol-3-phosphate dehydrogenase